MEKGQSEVVSRNWLDTYSYEQMISVRTRVNNFLGFMISKSTNYEVIASKVSALFGLFHSRPLYQVLLQGTFHTYPSYKQIDIMLFIERALAQGSAGNNLHE